MTVSIAPFAPMPGKTEFMDDLGPTGQVVSLDATQQGASHVFISLVNPTGSNDGMHMRFDTATGTALTTDQFYHVDTWHVVPLPLDTGRIIARQNTNLIDAYFSFGFLSPGDSKVTIQGFSAVNGSVESISATTSSASATFTDVEAVNRNYVSITVINAASSAAGVHVRTGEDSATATTGDFFIPAGEQAIITKPPAHNTVAALTDTGTATVLVSPGDLPPGS